MKRAALLLALLASPALADGLSGGPAPLATATTPGIVQPDDTTITILNGVISAVGGGGGGNCTVGGVAGDLQMNNGSSGCAASHLNDNGTIIKSAESIDTKTNATVWEIPNAASTGTTVNKLAYLTGAPSTALIQPTASQIGAVGIVIGGAGTAGSAQIAITGQASCVFDGATTAGHYVDSSTGTAGDCHDAGAGEPSGVTVVGIVLSTNGGAGTYGVSLFPPTENSISGSSGAATKPCVSTPNSVQYGSNSPAVPAFACAPLIDNSGVMQFVGNNFTFSTGFELFSDQFGDNFFGGAFQSLSTSSYIGNFCSGYDNSGLGFACNSLTNGSYNVGLGGGALRNGTSGSNNVGIGYRAGANNTSGSNNTASGFEAAGGSGSPGSFSNVTALGYKAGFSVNSDDIASNGSTFVGDQACPNVTDGIQDNCLGTASGSVLTTGSNNVCVGGGSCAGLTTGSFDISLATNGFNAQANCMSSASVTAEFDLCSVNNGDAGPIQRCNIASLAAGYCQYNVPLAGAGYTVSTLPASPPKGSQAYVTDAVVCTFLASLTGGGTAFCPVTYNGAAWVGG